MAQLRLHPFENHCLEVLKGSGARITQARRAVIRVLAEAQVPLSPKEILQRIDSSNSLENIDPVSVYRVLDRLIELNLIHLVNPGGQYVACEHIHCHAPLHVLTNCVTCGQTSEVDVPKDASQAFLQFLNTQSMFSPLQHHFQIDGYCKKCRKP